MDQQILEFVPMYGWKDNPDFGRMRVDYRQWIVYLIAPASGRKIELGYVGQHAGAPFNGIVEKQSLPEAIRQQVETEINARLGGTRRFFWAPPMRRTPDKEAEVSPLILPAGYHSEETDDDF